MYFSTTLERPDLFLVNPRSLERGGGGGRGGGVELIPPLDFLALNFCSLSKALEQLFLVCEHIF